MAASEYLSSAGGNFSDSAHLHCPGLSARSVAEAGTSKAGVLRTIADTLRRVGNGRPEAKRLREMKSETESTRKTRPRETSRGKTRRPGRKPSIYCATVTLCPS